MATKTKQTITIEATVNTTVERAWELYNTPEHVKLWNNASPDWHTPKAENNLVNGGKFSYRMEARDGSFGFYFSGTYNEIIPHKLLEYTIDDGRKVNVHFEESNEQTIITVKFETEDLNSAELQREGWQAILNNFKNYAENINK